jgi:hypothetical protein
MSKNSLWHLQERIFEFIFKTLSDFPEQEDEDGYSKALKEYQEFRYDVTSLARGIPVRFKNTSDTNFKEHCEKILEKLRNVYRFTLVEDEQLLDDGTGAGNLYESERNSIVLVGNQIKTICRNYLQSRNLLDDDNLQYVNFERVMWKMAQSCFTDHICDGFAEECSDAFEYDTQPEAPYGKGSVSQVALSMIHFGKSDLRSISSSIPNEMRSHENPKPIELHEALNIIEVFTNEITYLQSLFESEMLSVEATKSLPFETLNAFDKTIDELNGARSSVKNADRYIDDARTKLYRFQVEARTITSA